MNIKNLSASADAIIIDEHRLKTRTIPKDEIISSSFHWHMIIVYNVVNHSRDYILESIMNLVSPHEFIPSFYTAHEGCVSFLAKLSGGAILNLLSTNLIITHKTKYLNTKPLTFKIVLKFAKPTDVSVDYKSVIIPVLKKRYNSNLRMLDLTCFHEDPDLYDFFPLWEPKVFSMVLTLAGDLEIETLKLCNNRIVSLKPLQLLKRIIYLDLRQNKINDVDQLSVLKSYFITELVLEDNPICGFMTKFKYIDTIRSYCPKIEKLDGCVVPPISHVCPQKNYLCNPSGKYLIDQFLEHYFTLYDSYDRNVLSDSYHYSAMFSMTNSILSQSTVETFSKIRYNTLCRNVQLSTVNNLFVGPKDIIQALVGLSMTEHDPLTFTVDMNYATDRTVVFTVSGVFKETGENLLDDELMFSFTRTFVLMHVGSEEYKIVNEQLHICSPTIEQLSEAFSNVRVPETGVINVPEALIDIEKEQMQLGFMNVTDLKAVWAKKCLEECNYNMKFALDLFTNLLKMDRIPSSAFRGDSVETNLDASFVSSNTTRVKLVLPIELEPTTQTPVFNNPPQLDQKQPQQPQQPAQQSSNIQDILNKLTPQSKQDIDAILKKFAPQDTPQTEVQRIMNQLSRQTIQPNQMNNVQAVLNKINSQSAMGNQPNPYQQQFDAILTKYNIPPSNLTKVPSERQSQLQKQAKNTSSRFEPPAKLATSSRFEPPAKVGSNSRFEPPPKVAASSRFEPPPKVAESRFEPPSKVAASSRFEPPSKEAASSRFEPPSKVAAKQVNSVEPTKKVNVKQLPVAVAASAFKQLENNKPSENIFETIVSMPKETPISEIMLKLTQAINFVFEKYPNNPKYYRLVGKQLYKNKMADEARDMLSKAMTFLPKPIGQDLYSSFILMEVTSGGMAHAKPMIRHAVKEYPINVVTKLLSEHTGKVNVKFTRESFDMVTNMDLSVEIKQKVLNSYRIFESIYGDKKTQLKVRQLLEKIAKKPIYETTDLSAEPPAEVTNNKTSSIKINIEINKNKSKSIISHIEAAKPVVAEVKVEESEAIEISDDEREGGSVVHPGEAPEGVMDSFEPGPYSDRLHWDGYNLKYPKFKTSAFTSALAEHRNKLFRTQLFIEAGILPKREAESLMEFQTLKADAKIQAGIELLKKFPTKVYVYRIVCIYLWDKKKYKEVLDALDKNSYPDILLLGYIFKVRELVRKKIFAKAISYMVDCMNRIDLKECVTMVDSIMRKEIDFSKFAFTNLARNELLPLEKRMLVALQYKTYATFYGNESVEEEANRIMSQNNLDTDFFHPDDTLRNPTCVAFRKDYVQSPKGSFKWVTILEFINKHWKNFEAMTEGTRALYYHGHKDAMNTQKERIWGALSDGQKTKYMIAVSYYETFFGDASQGVTSLLRINQADRNTVNVRCAFITCNIKMKQLEGARSALQPVVNNLQDLLNPHIQEGLYKYYTDWVNNLGVDLLGIHFRRLRA